MKKSTKSLLTWLSVIVLVGVVIFAATAMSNKDGEPKDNETNATQVDLSEAVSPDDWSKGTDSPKVTIVEYSDFQCPACKNMSVVVDEIMAEFNQHVKFVYRHFPLRAIHANAQMAAQAAEAAGIQEKFWEMHDLLFANQSTWSSLSGSALEDEFASYAQQLNLDLEKFKADLDSSTVKNLVNSEADQAKDMKLSGTPTLFINGVKIQNPTNMQAFRKILTDEITKQ